MRRALPIVAVIVLLGCADETVILATIPDTDASIPAPTPMKCAQPSDCPAGLFCDHEMCNEPAGMCVPFPIECPDDEHPVCGCDGVTYFNDCLRRAAAVPGTIAPQECGQLGYGIPCGGGMGAGCPPGADCALLLGRAGIPTQPACPPDPSGMCWVIPSTCADAGVSDQWDDCDDGGSRCVSTCAAIRSGRAYQRSQQCP